MAHLGKLFKNEICSHNLEVKIITVNYINITWTVELEILILRIWNQNGRF